MSAELMTTLVPVIAGIVVCVLLSGFFSASEMIYSACNRMRLENLKEDGDKHAAMALRITEDFRSALTAILIGNNLVNIVSSSLTSVLVILIGAEQWAWAGTLVISLAVIVFGETIPKITAKKRPNTLALRYAAPVRAVMLLFLPLVKLTVWLMDLITRRMPKPEQEDADEAVETLQSLIETAESEDVLDEDRSELVQAAIDFSDIPAYEVMTARVDMDGIDIDDDPAEIRETIERSTHSRLPVYKDSVDNIVGVLYVNRYLKALTETDGAADIQSMLMKPVFIYKTMKLPVVLNRLKKAKQHLAIVTDEYGGTLGVISMEDVLEEIVGDIWDETDTVEPEVVECENGSYQLDGDMPVSDFLELFGIDETDFEAESETVGGWTTESLEKFPAPGDSFRFLDLTVTVLSADDLRVERVKVTRDTKTK
ncbi:MAG: hemolysin family protein [Clostridia bacterium]|nr:hemolysin family protein [Clostridia bacterium]